MVKSLTLQHAGLLLLAAPAILLIVAALRRGTRTLPAWRRAASLAVRTALVLLITLVMTRGVVTVQTARPYLTVFLADVSESVPPAAWEAGADALRRAWATEVAAGNRCALVAFAGRSEILVPPTDRPLEVDPSRLAHRAAWRRLAEESEREGSGAGERLAELAAWQERLQVAATDFGQAVRTARALFVDGATNRIVLMTDGRVPPGQAPLELRPEDSVVRLEGGNSRDVAIVHVEAPLAVPSGEPFDVRVTLHAAQQVEGRLSLTVEKSGLPEITRPFRLPAGRGVVVLENVQQKAPVPPGLYRIEVIAHAPGDEEPRNNVGGAAVGVTGKPRVLLVEGTPTEAEPLAAMLKAQEIDFVRESPQAFSARGNGFENFVAVVLVGVPRESLPDERVAALRKYLETSGGGLWVVGSSTLQGARGYAGSEMERLLPVTFSDAAAGSGPGSEKVDRPAPPVAEPQPNAQKVLTPTIALLFIVDKSGSMAGPSIQLVKAACIASAKVLTPKDVVGVLAFDAQPKWVLEFTQADKQEYIEDKVMRLFADGGTHIQPALVEALNAFRTVERAKRAGVRHAILLSDGDTRPADMETVTRQLVEEGVTVTTVCVAGPSFDPFLMKQLATVGRGEFVFAHSFKQVPQIFIDQTTRIVGTVPRDPNAMPLPPPPAPIPPPSGKGDTRPPLKVVARDEHDALQGVDKGAIPSLRGKLGAAARSAAGVAVPLATEDGQPVLALWRVGLGKSAVWTSDLSGRWSMDWLRWPSSSKVVAQLVRHLSSAPPDAELASRVRLSVEGPRAFVRIEPGEPGEDLSAPGTPEPLTRTPDGGFSFHVRLDSPNKVVPIKLKRDDRTLTLGAVRPYEAEFAPTLPSPDALSPGRPAISLRELEREVGGDRMWGDRRTELSPWLIVLALLLLPLDVALRRMSV